jgi:antitoxin PrlF
MSTATLTSKGQITLPSELRRSLQLNSGDRIEFFHQADGTVALRPVRDLKGIVPKPGKPVSIAQMKRAVASAIAKKDKARRS